MSRESGSDQTCENVSARIKHYIPLLSSSFPDSISVSDRLSVDLFLVIQTGARLELSSGFRNLNTISDLSVKVCIMVWFIV